MPNKPNNEGRFRGRAGSVAGLASLLLLGMCACASAQIPYDLGGVEPATRARHDLRVAVLPFEDERVPEAAQSEDGLFSYRGLDYEPTDVSDLRAPLGFELAELLARHLVRAGSFREVVLVRDMQDASDAQLVLKARIRRARGYAEAEGQRAEETPTTRHRNVIAEVFLSDVELVEPDRPGRKGRRLLHADLGWSILEERSADPKPPSPWQVLGEALFESHRQLVQLIEHAVLDGSFVAVEEVRLRAASVGSSTTTSAFKDLGRSAPQGWSFEPVTTPSAPSGWRANSGCQEGRFAARQTQRFHRALGPYQPTVRIWLCPSELELALDHRAEFPAVYLGRTAGRENAFVFQLGPSSWAGAEAELGDLFQVTPPASKYVFRIEAVR